MPNRLFDYEIPGAMRFADINSDGKDDYCTLIAGHGLFCVLSTGSAFTLPTQPINPTPWGDVALLTGGSHLEFGDIDGANGVDLCVTLSSNNTIACAPNLGGDAGFGIGGFTIPSLVYVKRFWVTDVFPSDTPLADICYQYQSGAKLRCHSAAGGNQFAASPVSIANFNGGISGYVAAGDVNGDGRTDFCGVMGIGTGLPPTRQCYKNGNQPIFADTASTGLDENTYGESLQLADIDGDGKDDICAYSYLHGFVCERSNGVRLKFTSHLTLGAWSPPSLHTTIRVSNRPAP